MFVGLTVLGCAWWLWTTGVGQLLAAAYEPKVGKEIEDEGDEVDDEDETEG